MNGTVAEAMAASRKKIAELHADARRVHTLVAEHRLTQDEGNAAIAKIEEQIVLAQRAGGDAGIKALEESRPAFEVQRRAAAERVKSDAAALVESLSELREVEMARTAESNAPEFAGRIFEHGLPSDRHLWRILADVDSTLVRHFSDRMERECAVPARPKPRIWSEISKLLPASAR